VVFSSVTKIRTPSDCRLNYSPSNDILYCITMHPKTADKFSIIMLKDEQSLDEGKFTTSESFLMERNKNRRELPSIGFETCSIRVQIYAECGLEFYLELAREDLFYVDPTRDDGNRIVQR
jgi:hypothetical protein